MARITSLAAARAHRQDTQELSALVSDYLQRYSVPTTIKQTQGHLRQLFEHANISSVADLTESNITQWIVSGKPANNTARQRISDASLFLRWLARRGYEVPDHEPIRQLNKRYPKTYGKVQDHHNANRLNYDQAFNQLIAACKDGTWVGSRDQLIIRLGLAGLRAAEIAGLTWADRTANQLNWIGKGRKPRSITVSNTLNNQLDRWRREYERNTETVTDDMPILCTNVTVGLRYDGQQCILDTSQHIVWGKPIPYRTLANRVTYRAKQAGLEHMSSHDLRRSCARILHEARTPDEGHIFDLNEIREVLGHASADTTLNCYIGPITRDAQDRAARYLE